MHAADLTRQRQKLSNAIDLLHCPFCGHPVPDVVHTLKPDDTFAVRCEECGTYGPVDESESLAAAMSDNFKRSPYPPAVWERRGKGINAASRAIAMDRLGIPPMIEGLSWS